MSPVSARSAATDSGQRLLRRFDQKKSDGTGAAQAGFALPAGEGRIFQIDAQDRPRLIRLAERRHGTWRPVRDAAARPDPRPPG